MAKRKNYSTTTVNQFERQYKTWKRESRKNVRAREKFNNIEVLAEKYNVLTKKGTITRNKKRQKQVEKFFKAYDKEIGSYSKFEKRERENFRKFKKEQEEIIKKQSSSIPVEEDYTIRDTFLEYEYKMQQLIDMYDEIETKMYDELKNFSRDNENIPIDEVFRFWNEKLAGQGNNKRPTIDLEETDFK